MMVNPKLRMLFLKKSTKNFENKMVIMLILMKWVIFTHIFFLQATFFVNGKNSPAIYGRKNVVLEALPLLFSLFI